MNAHGSPLDIDGVTDSYCHSAMLEAANYIKEELMSRNLINKGFNGLGVGGGELCCDAYLICDTVGQEIFADMIFSRILRILTKPRKYHVREYDVNDLFAKKV